MRARALAVWLMSAVAVGCSTDEGSPGGFAEHSSGGTHVVRDDDGRVLAVRGRFAAPGGGSAEARAEAFIETYRDLLGLPKRVALGPVTVTGTKIQTVSFRLAAGGHPIEGGRLAVRLTSEAVFFVMVSAPPNLPELPKPTLDAAAAKDRATKLVSGSAVLGEPELVVYAPALLRLGTEPPRLAWRVTMQPIHEGVLSAPVLFVDAVDGSELGRLDRVRRARERKIYDIKSCVFSDDWGTCEELIYDESGVSPGATPWPEASTAWTFAADGCDFLQQAFSEDSPCTPLVVYLNSRQDHAAQLEGKLWFGEGVLTDTEGYGTFLHELGHALVDARSERFQYLGQSGAVQEALADVVSMLATEPAEWVVDAGHPDERNISEPGAAADNPSTVADLRAGEVHYNSVILSHAIWLATVKGLEVRLEWVEGIGYADMTAIIDELLRGYLADYVTLHQAAAALIDACMVHPMFYDTFGVTTANLSFRDCGLLVNALAEVGLSSPDNDLDGWPDDADNCPDKPNPWQENTYGDKRGDACEEDSEPPDPTEPKAAYFPCPAAFATSESGSWSLVDDFGNEPTSPVYYYVCRYGRPAGVSELYPEKVAVGVHWSTEDRGSLGCGYPPQDAGFSSETHNAYVTHSYAFIAFKPGSTFYKAVEAFAQQLLGTAEQGTDGSGRAVLPGGAAPCE